MNLSELPQIGQPLNGGFYAGLFSSNGIHYALIVSPKSLGEITDIKWGTYDQNVDAMSCHDGLSNTNAMADAQSELATKIRALNINEFNDWYLPSRDELEILYRNLKPSANDNCCSFRDGDNASSIPAGFLYTESVPAQTTVPEFQSGGTQAFDSTWYWASTQRSAHRAWLQDFGDGCQLSNRKYGSFAVRAVRRELVI